MDPWFFTKLYYELGEAQIASARRVAEARAGGYEKSARLRCCSVWGSCPARPPWAAWWHWVVGASFGWILPGHRALPVLGLHSEPRCLCFSLSRHRTQSLGTRADSTVATSTTFVFLAHYV